MFGIGGTELAIIIVFVFLLFGPDKLPGMGRTIGRALRQFKSAQEGFTEVVQTQVMDPLNDAMNGTDDERKAKRAAALGDDADLENESVPKKRANETFAERKARLKAERAAKEAAQAREGAQAAEKDGDAQGPVVDASDDVSPTAAVAHHEADDAAASRPDTSAAALWSMSPKKAVVPASEEDGVEPVPAGDATDADADLDADRVDPADADISAAGVTDERGA
ncbi:twin-arginine translocase TatA/TatE family subunit [Olsenella massiliensis]|uniref:twin-arginine translocase TatA/TatE family subunit n=1 Tax=Olsenella massiliensis TaxID=1622075 RepID=UPI00071D1080|nr:twin-arginine translocase TatA/TatE family subunit [Olsenella massiliensis]